MLSKATTLPEKHGGNKKKKTVQTHKTTRGKKTLFHRKKWWAAPLFILFPDLFEIIAQSAHGSGKPCF